MIDDMAVYIANLGKYNEGYLVGAWFTFPIDEEDVKEKIGLNEQYEEYAIHDTDNFPIAIGEYKARYFTFQFNRQAFFFTERIECFHGIAAIRVTENQCICRPMSSCTQSHGTALYSIRKMLHHIEIRV